MQACLPFSAGLVIALIAVGCGTTRDYQATEQLVLSDAVDRSVSTIDFRPLTGRKVYLDTSYLRSVKTAGFVNADYVTSALRQQIVAAGCYLQDSAQDADLIIEARIGTLGPDDHRVTYGIPENNALNSAASLIPNSPTLPSVPEIAVARREAREAAAKIAAFAYDKETRKAVWQSGINQSTATARDTWVLGVGPFQSGSIRQETKLAGSKLIRFGSNSGEGSPARRFDRPPVDYTAETRFQEGWPVLDQKQVANEMLQMARDRDVTETPDSAGEVEAQVAEAPPEDSRVSRVRCVDYDEAVPFLWALVAVSAAFEYRLIDFGEGRKLESFGSRIVDRPCPAATCSPRRRDRWALADSRFDGEQRRWIHRTPLPEAWSLACGSFRMPLRPTPFGHVGVFPEQRPNWDWLQQTPAHPERRLSHHHSDPVTSTTTPEAAASLPWALNLFAYTGGSSMALAKAGYAVSHVDAARPNVASAKRAADLNGLQSWPIRYLVEDARRFVGRELRRGRSYRVVVLDPPSYGHGPGGKAWRIERDLPDLIVACVDLLDRRGGRLLITGHSAKIGASEVLNHVEAAIGQSEFVSIESAESGRLEIPSEAGGVLDAGFCVRVTFTA